jgi:hypothetical protein
MHVPTPMKLTQIVKSFTTAATLALALIPLQTHASQTTVSPVAGYSTWTVPAGVTQVRLKLWGAGGCSFSDGNGGSYGDGGGGAFVTATYAVTPGQVLSVWRGYCNSGGQASAVWSANGLLIVASGGGASGYGDGGSGGAGGVTGQNGGDANGDALGGTGASAASGGIGGAGTYQRGTNGTGPIIPANNAGVFSNGGSGCNGCNGGGGYYGGGGGGDDGNWNTGAGGGGSSYIGGSYVAGSNTCSGGYYHTPGGTGDPDWATAGYPGGGGTEGSGGDAGAVLIQYNLAPASQTINCGAGYLFAVTTSNAFLLTLTGYGGTGVWHWSTNNSGTFSTQSFQVLYTPLVAGTHTLTVYHDGDINYLQSNTLTITLTATGPTRLFGNINGPTTYTITVPSNANTVSIKAWGAGGCGTMSAVPGGGGGFVAASYSATPGSILTITPARGSNCIWVSATATQVSSTDGYLVVAGSGGNGGAYNYSNQYAYPGGAAGSTGQDGSTGGGYALGGHGATQTAPGAADTNGRLAGNGSTGGGSAGNIFYAPGGSGYFGGGSGGFYQMQNLPLQCILRRWRWRL